LSLLCVPILVHDAHSALDDCRAAKAGGADMVELRIDELPAFDDPTLTALESLIAGCPLPCILTCRSAKEGGGCDLPDAERLTILERLTTASKHPPTYVDVEWAALPPSPREGPGVGWTYPRSLASPTSHTRLLCSSHDFQQRPSDLTRRVSAMAGDAACAVVKAAWRARSLHDALEALELPVTTGKPTIALAMGEFGVMSRVLAPKFGGFLTFAPLRAQGATAPGQPTISDLRDVYRVRAITRATRVYGIVGFPVAHSLSPLVHNAGFAELSIDAAYVPMPIAAYADAGATYAGFRAALLELIEHPTLDFHGVSVTMPHKHTLARLATEQGWDMDDATRDIGAANTLIVERENRRASRIRVANTDVQAVAGQMESLGTAAPGVLPRGGVAQARIGVIGAGGMAQAAAYACARAGAHVTIYNRDAGRARAVAAEVARFATGGAEVTGAPMHDLLRATCGVFIQCTPLGMSGSGLENQSALPVHDMHATPRSVVVLDTVYTPLRTPTLVAAEERGWHAINGLAIFARQAVAQMSLWSGRDAGTLLPRYTSLATQRLQRTGEEEGAA
jgi:3-dehydroquinate dehydratase/shikimate dehydrogenase